MLLAQLMLKPHEGDAGLCAVQMALWDFSYLFKR